MYQTETYMTFRKPLEILSEQLINLLDQLSDDEYKQPLPIILNASIGQHVRHIVELFQELQQGLATGMVNYDNRKRDYFLESNRQQAMEIIALIPSLSRMEDRSLILSGIYSVEEEKEIQLLSNYYRELIYNIEHAIHHMALLRVAAQHFTNIFLPDDFGMAVSTQRHNKKCAQ